MTPEERFMFDLEGYLVIKNVLTSEEVKRLNEVADATFVRDYDDPGKDSKGRVGRRQVGRVSAWSPETQALIDHPRILPYLIELLGPGFSARSRLLHLYEAGGCLWPLARCARRTYGQPTQVPVYRR